MIGRESNTYPNLYRLKYLLKATGQSALTHFVWLTFLEAADRHLLIHVCQDPVIDQVYKLAKDFAAMVGQRRVELLNDWLASCPNCSVVLLQQFGVRLQQDSATVGAAQSAEWRNGQTECQVTRIKLIKGQMYERAKLDLLRQRVLYRC